MSTLSVAVITRNEAANIRRCLDSVAWADEIIVVDSGSTDGTVEASRPLASKVYVREFDAFDSQKNFAVQQATGDWVLSLDADEVVSPALRDELRAVLARDGDGCDGFVLQRTNYLCGRPLRYIWGRDALVRLVRKGRGRFRNAVHEKLHVEGRVAELTHPLLHYNSASLSEYLAKNHQYIRLEAQARYQKGDRFRIGRALGSPVRVFLFRYLRLGGFRDGRIGLIVSVLLAFFTFLMHVSLWELSRCGGQECAKTASPTADRRVGDIARTSNADQPDA